MDIEKLGVEGIPGDAEGDCVLVAQRLSHFVKDETGRQYAMEFGKSLKEMKKKIQDHYHVIKEKANETHKQICKEEKEHLAPVLEAEEIVRTAVAAYDTEKANRLQLESKRFLEGMKNSINTITTAVDMDIAAMQKFSPPVKGSSLKWELESFNKREFILALAKAPNSLFSSLENILEVKNSELKKFLNSCNMENPFPGIKAKQVHSVRF